MANTVFFRHGFLSLTPLYDFVLTLFMRSLHRAKQFPQIFLKFSLYSNHDTCLKRLSSVGEVNKPATSSCPPSMVYRGHRSSNVVCAGVSTNSNVNNIINVKDSVDIDYENYTYYSHSYITMCIIVTISTKSLMVLYNNTYGSKNYCITEYVRDESIVGGCLVNTPHVYPICANSFLKQMMMIRFYQDSLFTKPIVPDNYIFLKCYKCLKNIESL